MSGRQIAVIGGGVVGLACAHYLLGRGHRVTVVERGSEGHDCCSLGNAGYISPSHFLPLAAPGIVGQALRWMGNPESPFYLKPRLDPDLIGWVWRFWRAAHPERAHAAGPLLRDLNLASRSLFIELAQATGDRFGLRRDGCLALFQTEEGLRREAVHAARSEALGMPAPVLDAQGVAELEPEVTLRVHGGVHYVLDAHVTPERFHAMLVDLVRSGGGTIAYGAEVTGWRAEGGRIRGLVIPSGEIAADEYVLAAGATSARLLRGLGVRIPLQPGKGYSLTLDSPRERPRRPLLLQDVRVAITPMGSRLRFGGTMELGAFGSEINPPRIRGLVRSAIRHLPAFRVEDFEGIRPWCGHRPCTPDGLPYVGRLPGFENLTIATGHAMMGLSMAPVTGLLVSEILSGIAPSFPITALRPDRYAARMPSSVPAATRRSSIAPAPAGGSGGTR
jgi:D-amino-acid dehydrogenase